MITLYWCQLPGSWDCYAMVSVCFFCRNPAGSESQPKWETTECHWWQPDSFQKGAWAQRQKLVKMVFHCYSWSYWRTCGRILHFITRKGGSLKLSQQLKILSFPSSPPPFSSSRTRSLFCSSMVVYLFLQHLFAAILGPLGKFPTYTPFLQDMVPGGGLLHTIFLGTCAL